MPRAYHWQGNESAYFTAATLGDLITTPVTVRTIIYDFEFSSASEGYLLSQAAATGSLREYAVSIFSQGFNVIAGGVESNIVTTAQIEAEYGTDAISCDSFEVSLDLGTGAWFVAIDGSTIWSGTVTTGSNRTDGILFRIGARANSNTAGDTSGRLEPTEFLKMGDVALYIDDVLERYYIVGSSGGFTDSVNGQDATQRGTAPSYLAFERTLNQAAAIASAETFGTGTDVQEGAAAQIATQQAAIASAETVGAPTIAAHLLAEQAGAAHNGETFGSGTSIARWQDLDTIDAIPSAAAIPAPAISRPGLLTGLTIASGELVGIPRLSTANLQTTITPDDFNTVAPQLFSTLRGTLKQH